jgi:hypothetical protein
MKTNGSRPLTRPSSSADISGFSAPPSWRLVRDSPVVLPAQLWSRALLTPRGRSARTQARDITQANKFAVYSLRSTVGQLSSIRYGLQCALFKPQFSESRLTMPRPVPPEGRWIERHRLVSFYASDEVREWIDQEMHRTGQSKTQVIVSALEEQRHKRRTSGVRGRGSVR